MEKAIRRVAIYSIVVSLSLVGIKLALAVISGSLALRADAIHSMVDVFASVAVLVGVVISGRRSRAFPYGLYKVENVVAVIIAVLLFFTAYEIVREAAVAGERAIFASTWLLIVVGLIAVVPFLFGRYEGAVGRKTNSPSLVADGREFQTEVLTSVVVFIAVLAQSLGVPFIDRIGAGIVALFIIKAGWGILSNSVRVLLDASIDSESLRQISEVIRAEPAVAKVKAVTGRNSGRYRFVEAEVELRITDLERAHAVSQQVENRIKETCRHVDRVLIHYEPWAKTEIRYAVPLADSGGAISHHFGEAPYFAFIEIKASTRELLRQELVANPYHSLEKGRGIKTAELLIGHKVDVVLSRESLVGKGPGYAFADAGVEAVQIEAETLAQVLEGLTRGELGQGNWTQPIL
jgi:cation diffusion facilitator family transporter